MGNPMREGAGSKKKRGPRGSVDNNSRLKAFSERSGTGAADWGSCDAGLLQAVVVTITALDGAITFGLSRDQGAHSLSLILDGHRETLWFNGNVDLNEELERVKVTLEDID